MHKSYKMSSTNFIFTFWKNNISVIQVEGEMFGKNLCKLLDFLGELM